MINNLIIREKNIKFFIIKNKFKNYIYISVKGKKLILFLNNFFYNSLNLNYIKLYSTLYKNILYLKNFIFSWNNFFTKKIKVKHKISWLKLFRKKYFLMKINFGFSYNIIFFLNNFYFKKKKKIMKHSNILFWNIDKRFLFKMTKFIINIQYIDCYTLRGFKFSKQKFKKKVGKISKYMDFKKKLL